MPRTPALVVGLIALLTTAPSTIVAQDVHPPPIDIERWARFVVRDLFDTQPHERYVLMADPSYFPEFIDALRAEFLEVRAVELGTILFDGKRVSEARREFSPRDSDAEYKRLSDEAMRRLLEGADIFLWLPYRYGPAEESQDRRLMEHLVDGIPARGLHFHWVWNLGQFGFPVSQEDVEELGRMYEEALDIDYGELSAHQDRIIAALKGGELRITTPAGTDLRMQVPEDAWFHKNDGRLDREKAARARSVRDREMELPAGALRFIPDVTTTEGVFVSPEWRGGRNVRFEFRNGLITSVSAEENEDAVLEAWARGTGDKDRIAEIVIGTNPKLPSEGPDPFLPPYFGYGAGVLRVAFGENWESGGSNRSNMEAWFYITNATITAGSITIVEAGVLVLP